MDENLIVGLWSISLKRKKKYKQTLIFSEINLVKLKLISQIFSSKMSDIDRKKAEVRARLEAQAAGKKAKKGFMTPERKKKLRVR